MKQFKVLVEEFAVDELIRHVTFLANKSKTASLGLYQELFRVIDSLQSFPRRYPAYPTPYSTYEHRMAVHKYYLILYRIDSDTSTVYVRRILDGRANNRV